MGAGDELLAYYEEQAYEECEDSPGSIMSFNIDYGYLEGICRGFRSGFLRDFHYRQLCQCENMDDVKLTLSDTDFVGVMAELTKLTPEGIMARCRTKLVDEVDHLRSQAVGSLSTFLDYISYEYMINNVSFLIISLIKGANPQALLAKCDPLGKFPYMQSILTFENTQDGLIQLYRSFLVDTPVARYFERYFLEAAAGQGGLEHVSQIFHEEDIEVINDRLKKLWLEDFYRFTQALGGETATVMDRLLSWEADQRAIAIMINSFGTPLNESAQRPDRQRMFASFGRLYPNAIMAFENCDNMQSLGRYNVVLFKLIVHRCDLGEISRVL